MIKVGIIGSGFGQYALLPAFNSIKQCKVVALCGRFRPQLIDYCKKIGFKNLYTDWRKMFEIESLDAVALAVTPSVQYTIAKTAILQGFHVFAEKPLAKNFTQAKELLTLAKRKNVTTAVDFIFPEINAWQKVKKLIDIEKYGKLLEIAVNWDFFSFDIRNKFNSWKTSAKDGGGILSFFFSHGLYYLEFFAGKITKIQSVFNFSKDSINDAESGINLIIKFKNGICGNVHVNGNSRGLTRHQLIFYCEKGVLVLENQRDVIDSFTIVLHTLNRKKTIIVKKDLLLKDEDERAKIVRKIAKRFIVACNQHNQMIPSFVEGVRVQKLIDETRKNKIS